MPMTPSFSLGKVRDTVVEIARISVLDLMAVHIYMQKIALHTFIVSDYSILMRSSLKYST